MTRINHMMKKIDNEETKLKKGIQPQKHNIWYNKNIKKEL